MTEQYNDLEWLPPATAPRDGTEFIGCFTEKRYPALTFFDTKKACWEVFDTFRSHIPATVDSLHGWLPRPKESIKERVKTLPDWAQEYISTLTAERDEALELLELVRPRNPTYEPPTQKNANECGHVLAADKSYRFPELHKWGMVAEYPDAFSWWMPVPTPETLERLRRGESNERT